MAETEEERRERLRRKFTKGASDGDGKEKEGEGDKKASAKESGSESKSSKRGSSKKTPSQRRADEAESGKRTRGRPGTGDRLGMGRVASRKAPVRDKARDKKVEDPDKLANAVMAETPPPMPVRNTMRPGAGGGGGMPAPGMPQPPPGGAGGGMPMFGFSRMPPGNNPALPGTKPFVGSFSNPFRAPNMGLPPETTNFGAFQRMFQERKRPPEVAMRGAEARPKTPAPKTGPRERNEAAPKTKPPKKEAGKKSSRDRLADRMSDEDAGDQDYYKKLKRGNFRMG